MTHVTCRLTAKNRDQLRNPTLGNWVWATFTFFYLVVLLRPSSTFLFASSRRHAFLHFAQLRHCYTASWKCSLGRVTNCLLITVIFTLNAQCTHRTDRTVLRWLLISVRVVVQSAELRWRWLRWELSCCWCSSDVFCQDHVSLLF